MEKLYNNIVLGDNFPPKYDISVLENQLPVPYLENPPEVINISLGRQLFVDDFLIEETTLSPEYHSAKKMDCNPVFFPQAPWKQTSHSPVLHRKAAVCGTTKKKTSSKCGMRQAGLTRWQNR